MTAEQHPTGRLVPMSDAQYAALARIYELDPPAVVTELIAARDAAPADPVEAVWRRIANNIREGQEVGATTRMIAEVAAHDVLRALGWAS